MNRKQIHTPQDAEKLKEIPKWTRKYAQNRTVPFLIFLIIYSCLSVAIGVPSYFGGAAYQNNNMILFGICIFALIIAIVCMLIISVPKWGNKIIDQIAQRIYASEGIISISASESVKQKKCLGYAAGIIFGSCILGSVLLGFMGYFSIKYMQPISAIYVVPFLVFLYFCQKPIISSIALLWPILYAIHAVLIVAGVPILFDKNWTFLNMLIPTAGYGILCGLTGHIYNRYALKKLKSIMRLRRDTANEI